MVVRDCIASHICMARMYDSTTERNVPALCTCDYYFFIFSATYFDAYVIIMNYFIRLKGISTFK
jgi:hypothetical protein